MFLTLLVGVVRALVDNTLRPKIEQACDEALQRIKRMMSEGEYREAVSLGGKAWHKLIQAFAAGNLYSLISYAEFRVHLALALIYIGATKRGINMLISIIAEAEGYQKSGDVVWQGGQYLARLNWILGQKQKVLLNLICGQLRSLNP